MADEIEVMRGEPEKIELCGESIPVKKLSISKQIDLIEMWSKLSGEADKGMRESTAFMIKVVSFITGIPEEKLNEGSTIEEIAEAFGILYKRELLPLLRGAEKFKTILSPDPKK